MLHVCTCFLTFKSIVRSSSNIYVSARILQYGDCKLFRGQNRVEFIDQEHLVVLKVI